MNKWKYYELIAHYYGSFFASLEQGRTIKAAIGTTFNDYFFEPVDEYKVLLLIISIQNINIQMSILKGVYKGSLNFFFKQLDSVNTELIERELNPDETEHLIEMIEELKSKLKSVEIFEDSH